MGARSESFACEVELATTPHERRVLRSRMEAARQLYNACLGELLRRLDAARRDPGWERAGGMAKGRERSAAFRALREGYGLSEYSAHRHPSLARECWIREHLDANTAQKVATAAWRAVEAHMFAQRRRPRPRRRGELRSVEGKKADVGIRLQGWPADPLLAWDGAHARLRMALMLRAGDALQGHAKAARVKYVRLVRREIRGAERYFAQLVCEGRPPIKHPAREGGRCGIDVGPSSLAVADAEGSAERHRLADGVVEPARERRRLGRRADRQRRANNPHNYRPDGTVKPRGEREPWHASKRQERTQSELRETQRKLAARRRNEHGRLANAILAAFGPLLHAEQISYRAFQRAFGRSVRDRAPGAFMAELRRKGEAQGGGLVEVPTQTTFLSQRCLCGARRRKPLRERRHRCGCRYVPPGMHADRDELAAFLALFCDETGSFDRAAALTAWEGGANGRLLRADARETVAKPRAPATAGHPAEAGSERFGRQAPRDPGETAARTRRRGAARPRAHPATAPSLGRNPPASAVGNS